MRLKIDLGPTKSSICLIVISVLLALASFGCTSYTTGLQKSQARADETAAIAALRTVVLAQRSYSTSNSGNYATFQQLSAGGSLDSRFASDAPEIQGYVLTMKVGDKTFSCNADPASGDLQGRHFYVDSTSALIRVNATRAATSSDGALEF